MPVSKPTPGATGWNVAVDPWPLGEITGYLYPRGTTA